MIRDQVRRIEFAGKDRYVARPISGLVGNSRQFRLYCVENDLCPRAAEILVKAAALCSEAAD